MERYVKLSMQMIAYFNNLLRTKILCAITELAFTVNVKSLLKAKSSNEFTVGCNLVTVKEDMSVPE